MHVDPDQCQPPVIADHSCLLQKMRGFAMLPELTISDDKLCFIIAKAREFDVKDVVTDPGDSSNATDDAMLSVLEDHRG
jgi:hypothetical protein